ncbi:MAG: hypothetical protein KAI47_00325 [Deltaproteobacteria bacterium]|nr:hypothetical protein [Deltaproteobacteria bacterium]
MMARRRRRARRPNTKRETPLRSALRPGSSLRDDVRDGIRALARAHHDYLGEGVRADFADSLDLDEALREDYPEENRWDYLLGHRKSGEVLALEPHAARSDQVATVIAKKEAAREQFSDHLREGAGVSAWLWVASGDVGFPSTGKARRRLDQHGIKFVGRRVQPKDLP